MVIGCRNVILPSLWFWLFSTLTMWAFVIGKFVLAFVLAVIAIAAPATFVFAAWLDAEQSSLDVIDLDG